MSIYNELWVKENFFPRYNKRGNFNTNAESYYKYLERVNEVLKIMAKKIDEYDVTVKEYLLKWDKNLEDFPDDVKDLLEKWLVDGTLEHIINHKIFQDKLDKLIFEEFELSVNQQLAQTNKSVNDIFINVKYPPAPLVGAVGDGITNDTTAIQSVIDYVHSQRPNLDKRLRIFIPSGIYLVNQLKLPNNTNLYGGGRDNTTIKQVSGEVKDLIIDDEETGAYSIRVMDLRLDGSGNSSNGFNFGFHQPPSGYEFAMVWGVEGRMERVMVRNFLKTGFRVRSSVTSMMDVIAINCGVGFAFYGGSLEATHLIGHDCEKFIEFRGAGHKLFGVHYETGTHKTEPIIDFYNNTTDNIIHDLTVQINATQTVKDFIRIQSPSFGNKVKDIKMQGITVGNIETFINDEQARNKVKNIVSSYEQNNRLPIIKVTDENITNNSFRIYPETGNGLYVFEGTGGSVAFVMPRVSLAGLSVKIYNNTDNRLRINAHELDSGHQVFGGMENTIYIEAKGSLQLVSTGSQFNVQRYQNVYASNSGTVNLATGVNSTTVTHGLGNTPKKVVITPKGNIGSFWVGDIATGQFKIYCSTPPQETTEISWFAEL